MSLAQGASRADVLERVKILVEELRVLTGDRTTPAQRAVDMLVAATDTFECVEPMIHGQLFEDFLYGARARLGTPLRQNGNVVGSGVQRGSMGILWASFEQIVAKERVPHAMITWWGEIGTARSSA